MAEYKKYEHGSYMRDIHEPTRAKTRDDILREYRVMEIKRDALHDANYDQLQSPEYYFYAGIDPRRRNEAADAGMVREDRTKIANLSDRFIHEQYPSSGFNHVFYRSDGIQEEDK